MHRIRRAGWLVTMAALAGLTAVATVVIPRVAAEGPAELYTSVAAPPEGVPGDWIAVSSALVDGATLTLHGSTGGCSVGTYPEVSENDERVAVRLRDYLPDRDGPYFCTADMQAVVHTVWLESPLDDRRLVHAGTGDDVPFVHAEDILLPRYLPPGWERGPTRLSTVDNAAFEVATEFAGPDDEGGLSIAQGPRRYGPPGIDGTYVGGGTVDLNGHDAVWASYPTGEFWTITWEQNGFAMRLSGTVSSDVLIAIAWSVE